MPHYNTRVAHPVKIPFCTPVASKKMDCGSFRPQPNIFILALAVAGSVRNRYAKSNHVFPFRFSAASVSPASRNIYPTLKCGPMRNKSGPGKNFHTVPIFLTAQPFITNLPVERTGPPKNLPENGSVRINPCSKLAFLARLVRNCLSIKALQLIPPGKKRICNGFPLPKPGFKTLYRCDSAQKYFFLISMLTWN